MPCRGPESDMFSRDEMDRRIEEAENRVRAELGDVRRLAKERLEYQAVHLLSWLETEKLFESDSSNTAKLCGIIRSVGEVEFLTQVLNRAINHPEARQLIGWWEEHKHLDEIDAQDGR